MQYAIGIALAVVGIVLLVMGMNESESLASDFSRFFTGNPTDRSMWLIVGGIGAIVAGVIAAFLPMKLKKA